MALWVKYYVPLSGVEVVNFCSLFCLSSLPFSPVVRKQFDDERKRWGTDQLDFGFSLVLKGRSEWHYALLSSLESQYFDDARLYRLLQFDFSLGEASIYFRFRFACAFLVGEVILLCPPKQPFQTSSNAHPQRTRGSRRCWQKCALQPTAVETLIGRSVAKRKWGQRTFNLPRAFGNSSAV